MRRLVDAARRPGRHLGPGRHRVRLLAPLAIGAEDHVLVAGTGAHSGHEQLPDPGFSQLAPRVLATVPAVEVSLEPYAAGAGGPDGERRSGHVAGRCAVVVHTRPEDGPQELVPALVDQVQIHL